MRLNGNTDDNLLAVSTRAYAAINFFVVSPIAFILSLNSGVDFNSQWFATFFVSGVSLIVTARLKTMSERNLKAIFLTIASTMLAASCFTVYILRGQNTAQEIFAVFKISALVIAFLAPSPRWIGHVVVLACLLLPPIQTLLIPQILRDSGQLEPWATIAYALAALLLLQHQFQSRIVQRDKIISKANEKSQKDFNDIASAIGDLANSPLQSLDILAELLKSESIPYAEAATSVEKASYQLHELTHILSEHQNRIDREEGKESLDSFAVLRRKLAHISSNKDKRDF